ncbi:hypothetical protein IFO68_21190 [Photobacterium sp. CAU 1568]|uniref:Uncharacterized protein n=1 Tax=Photobacterium arenosum TaxID=2774143 RepID=A0ABR9BSD6_9GAMM|nr:hypothetical protein [Photobacterium arenosum]MBD8515198.1 hypothetical protein [Photobacterium arenosum]
MTNLKDAYEDFDFLNRKLDRVLKVFSKGFVGFIAIQIILQMLFYSAFYGGIYWLNYKATENDKNISIRVELKRNIDRHQYVYDLMTVCNEGNISETQKNKVCDMAIVEFQSIYSKANNYLNDLVSEDFYALMLIELKSTIASLNTKLYKVENYNNQERKWMDAILNSNTTPVAFFLLYTVLYALLFLKLDKLGKMHKANNEQYKKWRQTLVNPLPIRTTSQDKK